MRAHRLDAALTVGVNGMFSVAGWKVTFPLWLFSMESQQVVHAMRNRITEICTGVDPGGLDLAEHTHGVDQARQPEAGTIGKLKPLVVPVKTALRLMEIYRWPEWVIDQFRSIGLPSKPFKIGPYAVTLIAEGAAR